MLFALSLIQGIQAQQAVVNIDTQKPHQTITGFGGFVCSPQFTYNHMSTSDIKKVWGPTSTVGCNIMRLYIPIGRNSWSQSLATAKQAKQMGLIVFASPWGQPAEWKTNGTSNAKNSDGTLGYLKRENWPDYAQYLEDYVQYLRNNGVELDAISIQNEPDWPATYAGCLWSAQDIAEFVKTYGPSISCKVMAPETLAVSDSYANALNNDDVLTGFDIYGGHQYGGIQSAYKKLAEKGKELWMTEYLINWNEIENNTRNFDFNKDFFDFFRAINTCMLGDFNAWVHYAAKRYYAMLGDGQRGTTNSTVTKRGYVMAHFARFVTGMTRVETAWNDEEQVPFEGSAYLSQSGDTVVAVIANPSDHERELRLSLPFYTENGSLYVTTKTSNLTDAGLQIEAETCRPEVNIPAMSVATALFVRSRDRQPSQMTGTTVHFDLLDDQIQTKSAFGNNYKLSGKTKKFDHSNPLISTRTNSANGYVELTDRFSRLVMHVNKVTSTLNYTSALTTLYYVNDKGEVSSHDYGELDLSKKENFNLVLDLSPHTLPDGCRGLISLTNNNWSSTLTINFGDVYLTQGDTRYAALLSGAYGADDNYLLDYTTDAACTSIDLSQVTAMPAVLPWLEGTNRVAFLSAEANTASVNTIVATTCEQLSLTDGGGHFRPAKGFTTTVATLTCDIDGARLLMLPFSAPVPANAKAYLLAEDLTLQETASITAHQPVIVAGQGTVTFTGNGDVAYATSPLNAMLRGSYVAIPLYAGDYVLQKQGEEWGLSRLTGDATLSPFDAYARLDNAADFVPLAIPTSGITEMKQVQPREHPTYNMMGQRVGDNHRGIVVRDGKKYIKL